MIWRPPLIYLRNMLASKANLFRRQTFSLSCSIKRRTLSSSSTYDTLPVEKKGAAGHASAATDGNTMPHVNEEVIAYDKILNNDPSASKNDTADGHVPEEGIPVAEILAKDPAAMKHAPKVLKEGLVQNPANAEQAEKGKVQYERTDPVLAHVVGVIMRDGKKSQAQSHVQQALQLLHHVIQSDPVLALRNAVDAVSPLMRMIQQKKGSKNIPVPIPLSERQRRRKGIVWILEASGKRSDKSFAARLAQELAAVIDGTSAAFGKKEQVHKLALLNRANASVKV